MKLAVIGCGYVGLVSGCCLAEAGHEVIATDNDGARIAALRAGKIPIYEPRLDKVLESVVREGRLRFTADAGEAVRESDVIFICVGTPPTETGEADLSAIDNVARMIARESTSPKLIIEKSTVPAQTGEQLKRALTVYASNPGAKFRVASNPEFLREGTALHDSLYPDRVVIGSDDARSLEMLYTLYRPILDQTFAPPTYLPRPEGLGAVPLISTDLASAELIKYAANAFLALKISYINEIGQLAEKVGADIQQVAKGIGLDVRIGTRFLQAGIGWGGSCFGKDISALVATASEYSLTMPIVEAAREINRRQRERVVEKLLGELKILKGRTIGLLGLAFKPNTDDLREAPAIDIARKLVERGCKVKVHDPVAMERFQEQHRDLQVICCETPEETADDADALVLITEWQQYREIDWEALAPRMRSRIVLDGRNALDRARLTRFGFRYLGIGG